MTFWMRTLVLLRKKWRGKKMRRVHNNNKQTNKQGSGQNRTTAGAGAGQQNTSTAGVSGAPPPGVSARLMSPRPMVMPRGAGGSAGSGMDQLLQFMVANNQLKESREETERKERRELMEQKEAAREAERKERMERDEADRRERREERQLQQQQQQQQQQFMNLLMMQLVGKRNSPRILQEEKDDME
jgi:type IV secretory pathway VirB10-like protein